jgi:hypothetical protein
MAVAVEERRQRGAVVHGFEVFAFNCISRRLLHLHIETMHQLLHRLHADLKTMRQLPHTACNLGHF